MAYNNGHCLRCHEIKGGSTWNCDKCHTPYRGLRFACLSCNFDVCNGD